MLVIFCGQDTVSSRQKFINYKQSKIDEDFEVLSIQNSNITVELSQLTDSLGLFFDKKIIALEECLKDKKCRDYLKNYQEVDIEITIFESELSEKELRYVFPKAKFINSKLPSSVFTLLDSLTPKNLNHAISQLGEVVSQDNQLLIFYMIKSRIRELILVKKNLLDNIKLQAWQMGKLKRQASMWEESRLISCYDKLFKIEKNTKTSSGVFSIKQSLEML